MSLAEEESAWMGAYMMIRHVLMVLLDNGHQYRERVSLCSHGWLSRSEKPALGLVC